MILKGKHLIIRYCPGSADGSPAYLAHEDARMLLERDTAHLLRLAEHGTIKHPFTLPHTGACPADCRWHDPLPTMN